MPRSVLRGRAADGSAEQPAHTDMDGNPGAAADALLGMLALQGAHLVRGLLLQPRDALVVVRAQRSALCRMCFRRGCTEQYLAHLSHPKKQHASPLTHTIPSATEQARRHVISKSECAIAGEIAWEGAKHVGQGLRAPAAAAALLPVRAASSACCALLPSASACARAALSRCSASAACRACLSRSCAGAKRFLYIAATSVAVAVAVAAGSVRRMQLLDPRAASEHQTEAHADADGWYVQLTLRGDMKV